MTTFYKQIFVSPNQNVSAGDVNLLSAFLTQNDKNFNKFILSENDCVISGLEVKAPALSTTGSITVHSGFAIYASPNATTTVQFSNPSITLSYQGAIIDIPSLSIPVPSPDGTNDRWDAIDLIYSEITGIPSSRNFIDPNTNTVSLQTTNTETLGNSVSDPSQPNTNIVYTQGTPSATPAFPAIPTNCIRLALIKVLHGGAYNITQGNIVQSGSTGTTGSGGTLPRIFDLQSFPTNANAIGGGAINTADQSISLSDSLSAMRYQLNQIITTGGGNWFAQIPISLPQLLIWGGTDTGSANNYAVSIANFPGTLTPGLRVFFNAVNANTGDSTLAINGGFGKGLKDSLGNSISSATIQAGQRIFAIYDGTFWIMPYVDVGIPVPPPFTIANGSFEIWNGNIPQSWTVSLSGNATVSQDISNSIEGTSALKIHVPAGLVGTATIASSLMTIGPQNSYYIKFKTEATIANIFGSVKVTFFDSTQSQIGSPVNFWTAPGALWPTSWSTYYGILLDFNAGAYSIPTGVLAPNIPTNARYFSISAIGGLTTISGSDVNVWFDGFQFFNPGSSSIVWSSVTNGTYAVVTPGNCIVANVTLTGAGGGGGGSTLATGNRAGGGGGQGGTLKVRIPVNPDTTYTIKIGVGGTGPFNSNVNGNPGNTSTFQLGSTILAQANGGSGGQAGAGGGNGGTGSSFTFSGNTLTIINSVTGGNGGQGGLAGGNSNGGNGGAVFIGGNPYLNTSGGTQNIGGGATSPSGAGAGGAGACNGSINQGGQQGNSGATLVEF